jgi:hypothetical protein
MGGRLPFGVEVGLRAEKTLIVGGAGHERNAGWRVESVERAVTPQNVYAGRHGEVERRLNGDRGKTSMKLIGELIDASKK